jgi:hypothetical protein
MQKEYGGLLITISVTVTRLFPLKMACYYITNAREIDQGDAGQSAECRRLIAGPWATTQQTNARQKVELSIRRVF